MQPFTLHSGIAVPMLRDNIDTDAIIPSREMKRVSKQGLGEGLFAAWRYTLPGGRELQPDFILNQSPYSQASVLMSGHNFGCGSSREHAVWALKEFGIRAILASSFGSIFHSNCVRNGILPIVLPAYEIERIAEQVQQAPATQRLNIDLPQQIVWVGSDERQALHFDIRSGEKEMLVEGLDGIDLTLKYDSEIDQFETKDRQLRPWVYLKHSP